MGVYHLMGLGRSPGAITGPLSYVAHRYQRWNSDDQRFFRGSGEAAQRQRGDRVGDVQALVLFTTREVLTGKHMGTGEPFLSLPYRENRPGRIDGKLCPERAMREALPRLLGKEWPGVAGGRKSGTLFWCQVDRRDIRSSYERIVRVLTALAGVGGQGKEMWINLTSGNNVTNFALELAAALSGDVARLYYVQAENRDAEQCVRFTAEDGYWVDLPVMPLALSAMSRAVLDILQEKGPLDSPKLHSRLSSHPTHWSLTQGVSSETLEQTHLTPLRKQGLVEEQGNSYAVGPQWELIQPYEEALQEARKASLSIEKLAQEETWIEREEIDFH